MYRISLYREYFSKRKEAKRNSLWTALMVAVAGAEAVLIVSLAIGGLLLREQANGLAAEVDRLNRLVAAGSQPPPELAVAAQILAVRQSRCEWYPKLAALSCAIEPSLVLTELTGQDGDRGRQPRLDLAGLVRSGGSGLDPLSRFTKSLSNNPQVAEDFPQVALETVEGGDSGRFKVSCQAARSTP
jgi:hypothetical protein